MDIKELVSRHHQLIEEQKQNSNRINWYIKFKKHIVDLPLYNALVEVNNAKEINDKIGTCIKECQHAIELIGYHNLDYDNDCYDWYTVFKSSLRKFNKLPLPNMDKIDIMITCIQDFKDMLLEEK